MFENVKKKFKKFYFGKEPVITEPEQMIRRDIKYATPELEEWKTKLESYSKLLALLLDDFNCFWDRCGEEDNEQIMSNIYKHLDHTKGHMIKAYLDLDKIDTL